MKLRYHLILLLSVCAMQKVIAQSSYHPAFYETDKAQSYTIKMKEVFEDISAGKWDKAYKKYLKIVEHSDKEKEKHPEFWNTELDALSPLPEFAQSFFYIAPYDDKAKSSRPVQNYWAAYDYLRHVYRHKELGNAKTFVMQKDVMLLIDDHKDLIENALLELTIETNTEEAYDKLIATLFFRGEVYKRAVLQRENVAYSFITRNPTVSECNRFLQKYQSDMTSVHKNQIIHQRDSILYFSSPQTAAEITKFLAENPNTEYTKIAKAQLETLEYNDLQHTSASCKRYLQLYPTSKYANEVRKRETQYAFEEACSENTLKSYARFCKEYPDSQQRDEAYNRLVNAARKQYMRLDIDMEMLYGFVTNKQVEGFTFEDNLIYANFLNIIQNPHSALQMTGQIVAGYTETTRLPNGTTYSVEYEFNSLGLLTKETSTQSGTTTYSYACDSIGRVYTCSKTLQKGRTITYTPTFNEYGQLITLTSSNGEKECYLYNYSGTLIKRELYHDKSQRPYLVLEMAYRGVQRSTSNNVVIEYEYSDIEPISIKKYVNNTLMEVTSCTYDYEDESNEGLWTTQYKQNKDGSIVKTRIYKYDGRELRLQ